MQGAINPGKATLLFMEKSAFNHRTDALLLVMLRNPYFTSQVAKKGRPVQLKFPSLLITEFDRNYNAPTAPLEAKSNISSSLHSFKEHHYLHSTAEYVFPVAVEAVVYDVPESDAVPPGAEALLGRISYNTCKL